MDEYLSEKEQVEQIKQWWRDYGWYLVGGAGVSALGYFGWNQYNAYLDGIAVEAQAVYTDFAAAIEEDRANADELLARLRSEFEGSPYTDQASLLAARHHLIRDTARAAEELRRVMETSRDDDLAMVARLRLARVEAYRENYDTALAVLDVREPGLFTARIAEIRGDVLAARGELDQAREAYVRALTSAGSDVLDRNFVQMKLNALKPTPTPSSEAPAASGAELPAAGDADDASLRAPAESSAEPDSPVSSTAEGDE